MSIDLNKLKRLFKKSQNGKSGCSKIKEMLEQFTFFKNIQKKINPQKYDELINELSLVEYKKYQKVFSYGDMGRKFYVILQGSVFIITPDNTSFSFDKQEQKEIDYSFLENQDDKEIYEQMIKLYSNMKIVSVLKQDSTFGEVALRSNVPRTATVICREECTLIAINVDVYNSIVEEYYSALYEEDISFLQRFPFLQGWEKAHITNLIRYVRRVQCFGNQVIYNIGDPVEKIYLIKHGEFEIYQTDKTLLNKTEDYQEPDELDDLNMLRRKQKKEQLCRSAILSDYCSFGIEEIGSQQTKRLNKVVCTSSEALLYVIDKNSYFNVMQDRKLIKDLATENNTKQIWREKHGEERKVLLKGFYSPKMSLQQESLSFNHLANQELSHKNENDNTFAGKAKPPKQRYSLQLTNRASIQHFQMQMQKNQTSEFNFSSQASTNHLQNENHSENKQNSLHKLPQFQNKSKQQLSTSKLPQINSIKEIDINNIQDNYFLPQTTSNISQSKLNLKPRGSAFVSSSNSKIIETNNNNNSQRSLTVNHRPRFSNEDAQLNERPLLDCYVNAMLKKTMISSNQKSHKVFTQKEFFATIRKTQEKKRFCTPNQEGKNYIYSLHKQKDNPSEIKPHSNMKELHGGIEGVLGDLLNDQKVKQDLNNIKATFLHEQRMSQNNNQLLRKFTANYNL
ncbi:cyclic nucleotide-binding domain protein (macronuclear) [Tetrahymena thermophila SB210]|uniref:Cyclic nucleotide-binding domain protein n=1 Tax=Tetrahymena thermophila (strain SB210) TaxID=312017 RepID=I7M4Q3_TETTS|nr:cyclic nucleotide-binding domain protein [Tetrahymena thermophila SB210]EAS07840.2 cyclic nucleotide-binding domain protein [Tetrahymena thermophila SB210]|eukprot:XP_001028082.2 cyclic nucleotide-binding domain protein [Tetrahymena thermophila SB210]